MNEGWATPVVVLYFRRDLRLEDHRALAEAMKTGLPILPLFIFDTDILDELSSSDARVTFIYETLVSIHRQLVEMGSSLLVRCGQPLEVWKTLTMEFDIRGVFASEDYEPYGRSRDEALKDFFSAKAIPFLLCQDHVIFPPSAILKDNATPYTVFTPYKKRWLENFHIASLATTSYVLRSGQFCSQNHPFPSLQSLGFSPSSIRVLPYDLDKAKAYDRWRDFPGLAHTSLLGPHLRFGTVSLRKVLQQTHSVNATFVSELIWREFFMQVLFHFPEVVFHSFHRKYDRLVWRNDEEEFEKWKTGTTGFPLVDAGMRQLNETGYMHNRVRMLVASFLCKHLLIDWRWGELYFAEKLLDFELSANNGNWQWAAGTGCDAAPYFRVFSPEEQRKKFDPKQVYIRRWVAEIDDLSYPPPMVNHSMARLRAMEAYRQCLA